MHAGSASSTHARRRIAVMLAAAILGCGGNEPTGYQPIDSDHFYWSLTLDHEAITLSTLAPYDTLQLTATPRNGAGVPLEGLGSVTFRSLSPDRLSVTPDGLIKARQPGDFCLVVAELTAGGIRHADTAYVVITDDATPPTVASLSIHPEAPDSATWALTGDGEFMFISPNGSVSASGFKFVFARALNAEGAPVPNVSVAYRSLDTTVAQVYLGTGGPVFILNPIRPGTAVFTATTTAYGVTRADTVSYTITLPVHAVVRLERRRLQAGEAPVPAFTSPDVTIRRHGTVVWVNLLDQPADIVFEDPTHVIEHGAVSCARATGADPGGTGDVAPFGELRDPQASQLSSENCRSRSFPEVGEYRYRSPLTGATGRVVVVE